MCGCKATGIPFSGVHPVEWLAHVSVRTGWIHHRKVQLDRHHASSNPSPLVDSRPRRRTPPASDVGSSARGRRLTWPSSPPLTPCSCASASSRQSSCRFFVGATTPRLVAAHEPYARPRRTADGRSCHSSGGVRCVRRMRRDAESFGATSIMMRVQTEHRTIKHSDQVKDMSSFVWSNPVRRTPHYNNESYKYRVWSAHTRITRITRTTRHSSSPQGTARQTNEMSEQ
jgi:hypothetical protein